MHIDIVTIIGLLGGFFYLASHSQKDMIHLRVLSVSSNVLFIPYSMLKAGEILFPQRAPAHEITYVAEGRLKLQEVDHYYLGPGQLVGEIGLFSAEKTRTMTVVCDTDCELYKMTDEMRYRLYYQNPKLGFFFMRLIVERLPRDVHRGAIESER